jgi:hypothetical protein
MIAEEVRARYLQLRRYMSQTEARELVGMSRTTAWRLDKAAGLVDGPRDAGPRPATLDDPRPNLEGVLSPETLSAIFDDADDSTETADAGPAEPDPGLPSTLRVIDHDDREHPDDSGDRQAPTFGYGADALPASHPAASRRSFVAGRTRRIDPRALGPDPDLSAHARRLQ